MVSHRALIILVSSLSMLGGCLFRAPRSTPPPAELTREEIQARDIGAPPSDFERSIKDYLATRLKDPYSAVWDFSHAKPFKGVALDDVIYHSGRVVWKVHPRINAKNSYGGYVGMHEYECEFSGEIVLSCYDWSGIRDEECRRLGLGQNCSNELAPSTTFNQLAEPSEHTCWVGTMQKHGKDCE